MADCFKVMGKRFSVDCKFNADTYFFKISADVFLKIDNVKFDSFSIMKVRKLSLIYSDKSG